MRWALVSDAGQHLASEEKYYSVKIDSKRKQLASVQMLFKSFAEELESGSHSVTYRRVEHNRHNVESMSKASPGSRKALTVGLRASPGVVRSLRLGVILGYFSKETRAFSGQRVASMAKLEFGCRTYFSE